MGCLFQHQQGHPLAASILNAFLSLPGTATAAQDRPQQYTAISHGGSTVAGTTVADTSTFAISHAGISGCVWSGQHPSVRRFPVRHILYPRNRGASKAVYAAGSGSAAVLVTVVRRPCSLLTAVASAGMCRPQFTVPRFMVVLPALWHLP